MSERDDRRDPFSQLRHLGLASGEAPIPDPAFAARLRARIERALLLPEGVTVSGLSTTSPTEHSTPARPRDEGSVPAVVLRPGDIVYASLWVPDGGRAAAFFTRALDWTLDPAPAAEGRSRQVRGVLPHHGIYQAPGRPTLFLCFAVEGLEEASERVRSAGGETDRAVHTPYGRTVDCRDDQGMAFALWELEPGAPRQAGSPRPGELTYVTIEVEDSARFRSFFSAVLGWSFHPGRVEDGWQVPDVVPMCGLRGGVAEPAVVPMYTVADMDLALEAVRAGGGEAEEPERQPYGLSATCRDDQGTRFYLLEAEA